MRPLRIPTPGTLLYANDLLRLFTAVAELQGLAIEEAQPPLRIEGNTLLVAGLGTADVTKLGYLSVDFTTGTTLTLVPCDSAGVDLDDSSSATTDDVYIAGDQSSYTMHNGTKLAAPVGDELFSIVPYMAAADGFYYVLGQPSIVISTDPVSGNPAIQYDTTTHKFQMKTRDDWGWVRGTESAWVDIIDLVNCTTST